MLDILNKHLNPEAATCVVADWATTLSNDEQAAFKKLCDNGKSVNASNLFTDMSAQTVLPFKLTAFRSHLRGYCTCQK